VTAAVHLLVVCVGNVCRSPLAERLLQGRLDEAIGSGQARVSSRGTRALVGRPMDDAAAAELTRLGGTPAGFAARQLDAQAVTAADIVLTATRAVRSRVLEEAPRALRRTFTLRELAAVAQSDELGSVASVTELVAQAAALRGAVTVDEYDVPDPIGQPPEVHRAVADVIDESCAVVVAAIARALQPGPTA
jgi:protein-tyrosine phosphatase